MIARKLVYYGLVLTPSLMLGFIGLGARAYRETFEFDHYSPAQNEQARPYFSLLKATKDLPPVVNEAADADQIRRIGRLWADAVLSGKARTVPVLDLDESTSWVVCEEITSSKARLSWALWRAAQFELEQHRYDRAAQDLATSYVVSQATKGMNLFTITQANKRQEMVLNRLIEINPYLSLAVRQDVKRLFEKVHGMDQDTAERLKLVRTALKVSGVESAAQTFGTRDNYNYWKRLYLNTEKSISSLQKRWTAYCASADNLVCLAGPMPSELIKKNEIKRPPVNFRPYYAGRPPSYGYALALADH